MSWADKFYTFLKNNPKKREKLLIEIRESQEFQANILYNPFESGMFQFLKEVDFFSKINGGEGIFSKEKIAEIEGSQNSAYEKNLEYSQQLSCYGSARVFFEDIEMFLEIQRKHQI